MNERGMFAYVVLSLILMGLVVPFIFAQQVTPEGPDTINVTSSQRGPENRTGVAVVAQAGNVTGLKVSGTRITQAWQGYYGNVTGDIVLDDSAGFRFYNWQVANPRGEIFASNGTVDNWLSVYCLDTDQNEGYGQNESNFTLPLTRPDGSVSSVNTSRIELSYGINQTDLDGLNETFLGSFTGSIVVAGRTIDATDDCSVAHPYADSAPSAIWDEILLSDNDSLIFTSIIEEDAVDYRGNSTPGGGNTSDFQMLVLENGHTQQSLTTTTYLFYIELT